MSLARQEVEALYRRYGFQVERRCRQLLRDPDAAADAAHEVFVRLLTRGDAFRGEAAWTTWLYRVATNVCLNRLRDANTRRRLLEQHHPALEPAAAASPDAAAHRDAIIAVMGQFDDKTVAIALYYFVDELDQAEIGRLVELSRVSVNKRLQKFRERARELLRDLEAA